MQKFLFTAFFFGCKVLAGFSQDTTSTTEILRVENDRFAQMVAKNTKALARLLADELVYTHSDGQVEGKGRFLASLESGRVLYQSIETEDVAVRVLGGAAVVTGAAALRVFTGGQVLRLRVRYTDVYVRRDGRWQLLAWQSTRQAP